MSEVHITQLHIQKLGHEIEEIRIRALNHIISKLDHVIDSEIDFALCLELIRKLFKWFDFDQFSEETRVIYLLNKIFKSQTGANIKTHVGIPALLQDLKEIQYKIHAQYHPLLNSVISIIDPQNNPTPNIPELQLISDLPLSYRSDQSELIRVTNYSDYDRKSDQNSNRSVDYFNKTNHDKIIGPVSDRKGTERSKPGTTATAITGYEQKSSSYSGARTCPPYDHSDSLTSIVPIRENFINSVPYIALNWQPLVKSDYHVLKSVEESLQKPPQSQVLLHSCDFFCNVMLQDFPAEVFLQRPQILMLFYDMVQTSPSTRITNASLNCINKLSENLITRIRYYSDPCTYNSKQYLTAESELISNTPTSGKSTNYDTGGGDSDSDSIVQKITLPQYCIKTLTTILSYISEKPNSFKDTKLKKKTQSGINSSLQIIDNVTTLTTLCIRPTIWHEKQDSTILEISRNLIGLLEKLGHVLEQYRLMVLATNMEYFERMAQLHLLHSTAYLLSELIPIYKADKIIPRVLKTSLSSNILDSSFSRLYPNAHETLVQFVNEFRGQYEKEFLTKYTDVKSICYAMSKAIILIKDDSGSIECIKNIRDSLPSLEFHRNMKIINLFLKLCVKHNNTFHLDEYYSKVIEDTLLTLLSHPSIEIQVETYSLCQKLVINILGINHTQHLSEDPGSQLQFLFRPNFFIELCYGITSSSVQIQTYSEDILLHILKCKLVVSESIWKKIIRSILPALPILQCFTDSETILGKSILKFLDPDISTSIFISDLDVLKGNFRMLFCKDIRIRNEAVSRLSWLLSNEENGDLKIPKIKSLDDCALSNVFNIDYPVDVTRKKCTQQFYQVSSLQQVLALLSTPKIEPSIRRSALTQISVMLEDQFMLPTFFENGGLKLILDIFDRSLYNDEYENYPDSVIPIISILKNVCLYHAVVRQELSLNIKLYYNILRALFLYSTDKKLQSDSALLCCLLLYSEFAIYSQNNKESAGFSLPDIVVNHMNIPLKCHRHWKNSKNTKPSCYNLIMSDEWCKSVLRMHWNMEWYGGVSELIYWDSPDFNTDHTDFSSDLRLNKTDLLSLKASSITFCCRQYLQEIETANTHSKVVEAVRGVYGYIGLWNLANKNKIYTPDDALLKLNWVQAFNRFLNTPPANSEDENLLIEILKLLSNMLKLYKNSGKNCWVSEILQNSEHQLSKLLQMDVKNEQRSISLELLNLCSSCSTLEQQIMDIRIITGEQQDLKNKNWLHIIQIITDNLKYSDTDQFYNLAYLDKLLSCLVQITSNLGWSDTEFTADTQKIFGQLIAALAELLTAFHYGKGSEAASSFMGLSITRNALLTMNHILFEMQHSVKKNWEQFWMSDTICSSTLFGLFSLWSCRDIIVRAATLQLLAGISSSSRGATAIVSNVTQNGKGVWEICLEILLDHKEASIVREQSAVLLTNLCSHTNVGSDGEHILPMCHAPINSKQPADGMECVLHLLKEYNFYEELDIMLACLHMDPNFENSNVSLLHIKFKNDTARTTYTITSTSSSPSQSNVSVYVTPSMVKAVANFVSNLLFLAPLDISANLVEFGLIKGFFRCLKSPSLDLTDSRYFLLYTDTLDMCTSVCNILTRCIMSNNSCRGIILHTRDCLHVLLSLLNPTMFNVQQNHLLFLRNQLWSEIFKMLTVILDFSKDGSESSRESFMVISSVLTECGHDSFFKSVCHSMDSPNIGLQKSALQSLASLLTIETILPAPTENYVSPTFSLQNLLDTTPSPRDVRETVSEKDKQYKRPILDTYKELSKKKYTRKPESPRSPVEPNINTMIGADLCKILLRLYDLQNIENSKDLKRKSVIISALSSLLITSEEAKKCALQEGLLRTIIYNLKGLHTELSIQSADMLRKVSEKKRALPLLKEAESLFSMITNFIFGNKEAKKMASDLGVADLTHKYWVWFSFEKSVLVNIMKFLCTYTTNCPIASLSLTLTNSTPGSAPRKVVSNMSLLTAIINLIMKEMELVNKQHDISLLQFGFHVLKNTCGTIECRTIMTKSNLFHCFQRLHPAITKRQKPWEQVENYWLEFLEVFSFYSEGQMFIIKSNDMLDLILTLATCLRSANKLTALSVLRNVSFHSTNRVKLLSSAAFIQLLQDKLLGGTYHEKNLVVSMIWALAANSQRSKITLKCAGLDQILNDQLRQYEMQGIQDKSYQTMLYVLGVLKEGEN